MRRVSQLITCLAVLGLCVALVGCGRPPSVGGSSTAKAEKARKDAETVAVSVALAGETAQAKLAPDTANGNAPKTATIRKGPPVPKSAPRPGSPPVVRERVVSAIPYATEAEAEEDAIAQACETVSLKLSQLDPPVQYKPSVNEVRAEFLRKESRTVRPPDAEEKKILAEIGETRAVVYVEYDVEVSAAQVREMRSQNRVSLTMRIVGGLFALALAGFLFLRADEWTKGYLTSWLALAAVTLAGGAAAALIFI